LPTGINKIQYRFIGFQNTMFTSSLPDQQTHGEMETFMPHPVSLA